MAVVGAGIITLTKTVNPEVVVVVRVCPRAYPALGSPDRQGKVTMAVILTQ